MDLATGSHFFRIGNTDPMTHRRICDGFPTAAVDSGQQFSPDNDSMSKVSRGFVSSRFKSARSGRERNSLPPMAWGKCS